MIKKITFIKQNGIEDYLLAKEETVKFLFKGNYTMYLKSRLKESKVKVKEIEKYDKTLKPFESSIGRISSGLSVDEKEKEMYREEYQMTIKSGMETLSKYSERKTHIKTKKR